MKQPEKKRASAKLAYISPNQLTLVGFESPFSQNLNPENRWVVLANLIPWDDICSVYLKHAGESSTGRPPLNPRIIIGSLIIKHMCNLDDRETVAQITENMYMQYFIGYQSFTIEPPFDASLFVEFRKRLGADALNALNDKIISLKTKFETSKHTADKSKKEDADNDTPQKTDTPKNKGRLLMDATACPQDIAYPTDLNLLNDAREKTEELIDFLYDIDLHKKKPRTYREIARVQYLKTAQKKQKTRKEIRKAVGRQLRFVARNLKSVHKLLDTYTYPILDARQYKYMLVIATLYEQQKEMYDNRKHKIDDRIVSIHQPHVRPIVRGKSQAKVEFGAKIHVSLIDGISFLDEINWNAFNEGSHMIKYIENFKTRFGFYPKEVLADQIYCTRENRNALKLKGIKLVGKPLGRPSAVKEHVRPGERNPIEGKFGQAKTGYGLNRIRARLKDTSESWIASIILVLNLVKLAGVSHCALFFEKFLISFSALSRELCLNPRELNMTPDFFQLRIYQAQRKLC